MTPDVFKAWLELGSIALMSAPQMLSILLMCHARRWADRLYSLHQAETEAGRGLADTAGERAYLAINAAKWYHRAAMMAHWFGYAALSFGIIRGVISYNEEQSDIALIQVFVGAVLWFAGHLSAWANHGCARNFSEIFVICERSVIEAKGAET